MKPSTMRPTTGMALFGRSMTAVRSGITRSSVTTKRAAPDPSQPVFVDTSGRRGRLFRPLGITLDCILAVPIVLGGMALATDVGLPSVPWPTSAGSGSTSGSTSSSTSGTTSGGASGSARTSVAPVFTPSTTGTRATTVRKSTTSTTTSAGGSTPVPTPTPTPTPTIPAAERQGHE